MAKATLPTNYVDDIMNTSMGGKRRYNLIQNSDGTVSLEDVTSYTQVGSNFGAANINATNTAVNASFDAGKIIKDMATVNATTAAGYVPDALLLKEVNNSLTPFNTKDSEIRLMELGNGYKIIAGYTVLKYLIPDRLYADVINLPFTEASYLTFFSLEHATYFPNASLQLASSNRDIKSFSIILYDANGGFNENSSIGVHYMAIGI